MTRTLGLTLTALAAFAANSVLCRAALDASALGGAAPDAAAFTALRLVSGAAMLSLLVALRAPLGPALKRAQPLLAYAGLFSLAYLELDAGIGALILFGAVQVSMFAGALWLGERPPVMRWVGAGFGLAGLAWLAAPGARWPRAAAMRCGMRRCRGWRPRWPPWRSSPCR